MVDDIRRRDLIQDALERISRLSGINLGESSRISRPPENPPGTVPISLNEELSRRFPSLRMPTGYCYHTLTQSHSTPRATQPTRSSSTVTTTTSNPTGRKRKWKPAHEKKGKTVHKDLILIPDPNKDQVPTHSARVTLETEGQVLHGFPVESHWDAKTLRRKIAEQFPRLSSSPFEYVKVSYMSFLLYYVNFFKLVFIYLFM